MTAKALLSAIESDALPKMTLAERLVYFYLIHDSDRRGTLRLSQSDLAGRLGVTRQTIVKHVDALIAARLVRRFGHGRYAVYAEPWTLARLLGRFVDSLDVGSVFDEPAAQVAVYGAPLGVGDIGEEASALMHAIMALENTGILIHNDEEMTWTKAAQGAARTPSHRLPPSRRTRST